MCIVFIILLHCGAWYITIEGKSRKYIVCELRYCSELVNKGSLPHLKLNDIHIVSYITKIEEY